MRGDVTWRVAAEGDLAGRLRLEQQQRHAAERTPLQPLLQRMQADLHRRVLPQQNVVLEVHRYLAVEHHVQGGDELALESIADARRCAFGNLCREYLWRGRHGLSCSSLWLMFELAPGRIHPLPNQVGTVSRGRELCAGRITIASPPSGLSVGSLPMRSS